MRRTLQMDIALAIRARRKNGESLQAIRQDFGLSYSQAHSWCWQAGHYLDGEKLLAETPTSIRGLIATERLALPSLAESSLEKYGIETLAELARQEWSRAELLLLPDVGPSSVGQLALAMRAFGFALAPDREMPREREWTPEWQEARAGWKRREQQRENAPTDHSGTLAEAMRLSREIGHLEERVRQLRGEIYDEADEGECGPELVVEPHPAGPNVVCFPQRSRQADDWDGGRPMSGLSFFPPPPMTPRPATGGDRSPPRPCPRPARAGGDQPGD